MHKSALLFSELKFIHPLATDLLYSTFYSPGVLYRTSSPVFRVRQMGQKWKLLSHTFKYRKKSASEMEEMLVL